MLIKLQIAVACVLGLSAAQGLSQVVYVDAAAAPGGSGGSWASAFNDLQAGLAAARGSVSVREVRVAQGVYRPGPAGDRGVSFAIVEGVALRGAYAGGASATPDARDLRGTPSVLSGDLAGDDTSGGGRGVRTENAYHVVTAVGLAYPAVIDGFHIAGGRADGAGVGEARGGGVYIDQCADGLVVSRCVVRDNDATIGGGVMVLDTAALLSQCVVVGNRAVGWPGLRAEGLRLPRVPTADHCTFVYNVSTQSGTAGVSSLAVEPNPDPESTVEIIPLRMPVRGCIIAFNRRSELTYLPQQVEGFVETSSCLGPDASGWVHENNVTGEPVFADAAGADGVAGTLDDDLRLRPGSPGIDAGGSPGVDAGDVDGDGATSEEVGADVDGFVRVYGGASDIGASEGPVLTAVTSAAPIVISEGTSVGFTVRLTREPVGAVRVTLSAAGVGGSAPLATPAFVDLDSSNWQAGVAVSVSWPEDAGVTDDQTDLVLTGGAGTGMAVARQALVQIDGTTPPGVIYVNPGGAAAPDGATWASGYRTLEAALAVAAAQPAIRQVWVKEGTYRPPLPAGSSDPSTRVYVLPRGVELIGGFAGTETSPSQRDLAAHHTVLMGDNLGDDGPNFANYNDNCTNLLVSLNADDRTAVDGIEFIRCKEIALAGTASVSGGPAGENLLTVRNCRFSLNRRSGMRRAECTGSTVVESCVFEDNGSSFYGSQALGLDQRLGSAAGDLMTVRNCVFRRNGGGDGSCLWMRGRRLSVEGCTFADNVGGGAACSLALIEAQGLHDADSMVDGCVFERNTAEGWGAGLSVIHTAGEAPGRRIATVRACSFRDNVTTYRAGGLMVQGAWNSWGEVNGCVFERNRGNWEFGAAAGGVYSNCAFRENSAQRSGAGPTAATGCVFERNTATLEAGVAMTGTFTLCTFRDNSAPTSGALGGGNAFQCVFEENAATAGPYGAMRGDKAVDCVFAGNTATGDGGAGSITDAVNCRFAGNTAGGNGGALVDSLRMISCLLTGNTASGGGGAVYSVRTVLGCTVYGNHAGSVGGIDAVNLTTSSSLARHVANTIFWANTADTGTVEQQQLRFAFSGDPIYFEYRSGAFTSVGTPWNAAPMVLGPLTGGMTPAAIAAAVAAPVPTPYVFPYVSATPPGGLAVMTPGGGGQESWVSVLSAASPDMPSALLRMTDSVAPRVFATAEWRFSFAVDGSVGDALNPGLYLNTTPIAGSVGGTLGTQTDWVFDVSDLITPGLQHRKTVYIRNDAGYAGIRMRSALRYLHPPVAWCVVQGLNAYAGNGNIGADPELVTIAGPDGVVGTVDDDATPALTSLVIDSANSRLQATDERDLNGDGSTLDRIGSDLTGNPRVADCPVDHGAIGPAAGMDRGAVEVPPFQALMAPPCVADVGRAGGVYGRDGVLDNNDFIAFIDAFFVFSPIADMGSVGGVAGADGQFDNNDFIVFIDRFFTGC